jgi:GTP-binding protein
MPTRATIARRAHARSLPRPRDPLIAREIEFLGGMATAEGWRPEPGLPEIAFCGRSNVGKSSLINRLLRRRAAARVSKTPGRTREINFFRVNDAFILVDLPGYGYAKVSKEQHATWQPLIHDFLHRSVMLRGVVQLLDVRREPTVDDLAMFELLAAKGVPSIFVVTKMDKLSTQAARQRVAEITAALGLDDDQVVPFSATTGLGRDELAESVASLVAQGPAG